MIAPLTVIAGPMFAGKTSMLCDAITRAVALGQTTIVIKPAMDTRFGETSIVTHDGVSRPATPVRSEKDLFQLVASAVTRVNRPVHLFVDEMQFFEAPHYEGTFHLSIHTLLVAGHRVTAGGLDLDWRGLPFDVSARLLAMADRVEKLAARCAVSGEVASKTFRRNGGGDRIVLGAGDVYEPRANAHWAGAERSAHAVQAAG